MQPKPSIDTSSPVLPSILFSTSPSPFWRTFAENRANCRPILFKIYPLAIQQVNFQKITPENDETPNSKDTRGI
jgi:hypothetical protein